jgi:hypothetical protein
MGVTKHNSVVDPRGAVWGTENLYVADAVSGSVTEYMLTPERLPFRIGSQSDGNDYGLRTQYRRFHVGRPGKRDDVSECAGSALTCFMGIVTRYIICSSRGKSYMKIL